MSLPTMSDAGGWLLTAADAVLPDDRFGAVASGAAVAGVLLAGGWRLANPARDDADTPTLTPERQAPPMPDKPTHDLLDIPLDVVPRDAQERTPYDVVGHDALVSVVDQFYSKVMSDPDLLPFFDRPGVDMVALKRHQALFIGQLWGGPVTFPLDVLKRAHRGLRISPEKYWRVVGHLMVTLTHNDVPDWICVFTATRLYQARNLVIDEDLRRERVPDPAVSP